MIFPGLGSDDATPSGAGRAALLDWAFKVTTVLVVPWVLWISRGVDKMQARAAEVADHETRLRAIELTALPAKASIVHEHATLPLWAQHRLETCENDLREHIRRDHYELRR